MPKNPRRTMSKNTPYGKRGKSRRKQRATNRPTTLSSKQLVVPQKSATPVLPTSRTQQTTPQLNVLPNLKRIGIIALAMLLILIILYLVL